MFRVMTTIFRARSHDAAQVVVDANAMTILRQQLRDAAKGVESARRSVAVVMAYAEREKKNALRIREQIAELETRAMAALEQGREDLATEAAAAIAQLENELANTDIAITTYDIEIAQLRKTVQDSEERLLKLQRGHHLADALDRTQKVRGMMPRGVEADLEEAEATLTRLQDRQMHAEATAFALTELSGRSNADSVSARLAAAGCGAPVKSEAHAVLDRLKAKKS